MDREINLKLNAGNAEEVLDRLIAKAEKLHSILEQTEGFIEALDNGASIGTVTKDAETNLPPIIYSVSLGNLKDIMNTPSEAFSPAFLEEIGKTFTQIANTTLITPEQI